VKLTTSRTSSFGGRLPHIPTPILVALVIIGLAVGAALIIPRLLPAATPAAEIPKEINLGVAKIVPVSEQIDAPVETVTTSPNAERVWPESAVLLSADQILARYPNAPELKMAEQAFAGAGRFEKSITPKDRLCLFHVKGYSPAQQTLREGTVYLKAKKISVLVYDIEVNKPFEADPKHGKGHAALTFSRTSERVTISSVSC
jgi:hypothetical protein